MANLKSSKKDLRRTAKRRVRNLASALKTYVKRARLATAEPQAPKGPEALKAAISALDKAVQHGIIHKNQGARRKSRLARQLHAATADPSTQPSV
ncbi:MAG: 30S ribosomal protein S20 [Armatimonadota bacterium]